MATDKEKKLIVVEQLPTQPLREVTAEDGIYECKTKEEALAEILEGIRILLKKV